MCRTEWMKSEKKHNRTWHPELSCSGSTKARITTVSFSWHECGVRKDLDILVTCDLYEWPAMTTTFHNLTGEVWASTQLWSVFLAVRFGLHWRVYPSSGSKNMMHNHMRSFCTSRLITSHQPTWSCTQINTGRLWRSHSTRSVRICLVYRVPISH